MSISLAGISSLAKGAGEVATTSGIKEVGLAETTTKMSVLEAKEFCKGLFKKEQSNSVIKVNPDLAKREAKLNSDSPFNNSYIKMLENEINKTSTLKDADGFSIFKDDGGKIYQKGDSLAPNGDFNIGNINYKTDSFGRPIEQKGVVSKVIDNPSENRSNVSQNFARSLGEIGDQGAHGIANIFGAEPGRLNLTPVRGEINQGPYKTVENAIVKQVKDNDTPTYVKAIQEYANNITNRPNIVRLEAQNDSFSIKGGFDNVKGSTSLLNELGELISKENLSTLNELINTIEETGSEASVLGYIKYGDIVTVHIKNEGITGISGVQKFTMPIGG